jgi:hypothetical protein
VIPDRVDDEGMITSRDGALYQGAVGDLSVSCCVRCLFGLAGSLRPFVLAPLLQPAQYLGGRLDLVGGNVVVELGVPIEGAEDAFLRFLVEQYRVAIMCGDTYGPEGQGFIRPNVGCSRTKVDQGLGALGEMV